MEAWGFTYLSALRNAQVRNAAVLHTPAAVTSTVTSAAVDKMAVKRAWQWCPVLALRAVLEMSTRSWDDAFCFAILCLWLDCSFLSLVLETVYLNHTNDILKTWSCKRNDLKCGIILYPNWQNLFHFPFTGSRIRWLRKGFEGFGDIFSFLLCECIFMLFVFLLILICINYEWFHCLHDCSVSLSVKDTIGNPPARLVGRPGPLLRLISTGCRLWCVPLTLQTPCSYHKQQ